MRSGTAAPSGTLIGLALSGLSLAVAMASLGFTVIVDMDGWARLVSLGIGLAAGCAAGGLFAHAVLATRIAGLLSHAAKADDRARHRDGLLDLALAGGDGLQPGWHWQTDAGGHIAHVSDTLAAGLGHHADSLIGLPFANVFAASDTGQGWNRLVLAVLERRPVTVDVELTLHGQKDWWRIATQPLAMDDGTAAGVHGVGRDVTAERNAMLGVTNELSVMRQTSRRKSRFLAAVADELRGPLSTVIGFARHLLISSGEAGDGDQARRHLESMLASSQQLHAVTTVITDATRLERRQMKLVEQEADAAEIAEVAVKMCRDVSEAADVTLVASLIDGIELRCDVTRLKQALMTLVTACIAWTPAGRAVHVEIDKAGDGGLVVAVSSEAATLLLANPAELLEPYGCQLPAGLGLPVARQIAQLHAGDVTVEGAAGSGITFRLQLPANRVITRLPLTTAA